MSDWASTETGLTAAGILIWCRRCQLEVAHFTPEELAGFLADLPECEGCEGVFSLDASQLTALASQMLGLEEERVSVELVSVRDAETGEVLRVVPGQDGQPPTVVDDRGRERPFTATLIGSLKH